MRRGSVEPRRYEVRGSKDSRPNRSIVPVFDRSDATELREIDRWSGGFGWLAHPEEDGERASHAVRAILDGDRDESSGADQAASPGASPDDSPGVWVLDPVDAPGLDDRLADLGEVVGVVVCCSHHARDAGAVAERHDVAVYVPRWMDRVEERVDAPVERFEETIGDSGFEIYRFEPMGLWQEAIAYRESDGTLYVPDLLGTSPGYALSDERLGLVLPYRLFPPREQLGELEPERILLGHGEGVFEDASAALDDALTGTRRSFPRALYEQFGTNLRLLVGAMRD